MHKHWMESRYTLGTLIARSSVMQQLVSEAEIAAQGSEYLLIQGETGVGKKLLARAIHFSGRGSSRPFVKLQCKQLNASNLDAVLLGSDDLPGKLEEAAGGTLLFAGIDQLKPAAQARCLSLLQSQTFTNAAGETQVNDARIIATINREILEENLQTGLFSKELFWTLSEMTLSMPSLAERVEDIPYLVRQVLTEFGERERIAAPAVPYHYMELLMKVDWPENARQLRNHLESVLVLSEGKFEPAILLEQFEAVEGTETIRGAVQALLHRLQGESEENLAAVSARR